MRKQKFEKVLELTPIEMCMGEERAKEIAKKWSHNGLDFLQDMWHKYYTLTAHLCINSLMVNFGEKSLDLTKMEKALQSVVEDEEKRKVAE